MKEGILKKQLPGRVQPLINPPEIKDRPTIIAYSAGLNIIPFENVVAVAESYASHKEINIFIKEMDGQPITLTDVQAQDFVHLYNSWLGMIEALTTVDTMRMD